MRTFFLMALAAVALAATPLGTVACQDTRCVGSEASLSAADGQLVDDDTWQSTPMVSRWIDFGAERVWTVDLRSVAAGRDIVDVVSYVSEIAEPNGPEDAGRPRQLNFALAGGNLAVVRIVEPGVLTVRNATCATYYVRVVVHFAPSQQPPSDGAATDGGAANGAATDGAATDGAATDGAATNGGGDTGAQADADSSVS